jgi:hypothetical protein
MNPISIRKLSLSFTSHSCPNTDFRSGMRKIKHQRSVVDILPVLTANEALCPAVNLPRIPHRKQAAQQESTRRSRSIRAGAAATVFLSDSLGIIRRINTIVRLSASPEP